MGRIITFKAPAYHSISRATSPELDAERDPDQISMPNYAFQESPVFGATRPNMKAKSVSFSELPPLVCEVPHWDRSPVIPSPEDVENATDSDTDDESLPSRRNSGATSLEQATRWARRLSV